MTINQAVKETIVPTGKIGLWWLGQSGYVLKNSTQKVLAIDPYVTDTISKGYKPYIHERLVAPVLNPDSAHGVDHVLLSHDHQDHLDPNSVVILANQSPTRFYGSEIVCNRLTEELDIPQTMVQALPVNTTVELDQYWVTPVKAVHGGGAVGFVIQTEGITLYFSGDTQLFYGMREIGSRFTVDYAFLCFNGQQGNMDIAGAIHAAELVKAKTVIPNHYGMYADNTGDPEKFAYLLGQHSPERQCRILEPGQLEWFTA